MSLAPSAKFLVERFKLKERGRERGLDSVPSANQPTLDDVETDVVDYCNGLYAARRVEYHEHRPVFEERMRSSATNLGLDTQVEQACKEMKDAVAEERPNSVRLAQEAQQAIDELNRFKRAEARTADAEFPDSRGLHRGILFALVVGETLINGIFFSTNVAGGLFGGMTYAVLISVVNVVMLGWLAATMCRMILHRDPRLKVTGLAALVAVAAVAIFWNLFVAHYREALSPEYPPAPETLVANSSIAAGETDACWRGADEADADQEALCLFRASPFGLRGFYSYTLLLIGIAMCAAGALDWFKADDPYPGYGKRERRRRKALEKLDDDRDELLARVRKLHDETRRALRSDFVDPIEARELALGAFAKLRRQYDDLCSFAADLEKSCSGALDIYRTANREARSTPEPSLWQRSWMSDWSRPEAPGQSDLVGRAESEQRSLEARAAIEDCQQKLRDSHDDCQKLVADFTKLDLHDVPS